MWFELENYEENKFLLWNESIKYYNCNLSKHHFNGRQNVIQKFPPFVLSLPTSADDVKNVKFS